MSAQGETTERSDAKPANRRKLGRGLGALLGDAKREEPLVESGQGEEAEAAGGLRASGLASLAVAAIEPHPEQPRRYFEPEALEELAASIASRGVIQPVIVRPMKGGRYQLVAGERRWRAAQKAQLHEIPALIRDLEERDVMALALIENIQREDLNPIEEARAYQRLAESEDMTQAEIARLVEKSRSHVANLQRLLALPKTVLDHVESGRLDMGHARALIGHEQAEELAQHAVDKKLSVREVEKLARKKAQGEGGSSSRRAREPRDTGADADIAAVQNHLEEFLGLPVRITTDADPRSGTVTIRYHTLDQLDLVCQRLTGGDI
ncbi:ParB family chromosome partitioning protein [Altererythrobacter atlanticus]|uniref:Chromosome-partitioning protein ParB n=1 Tax=Croceibacterium atlanticum TaxID=1267766 RepID=A0A0F7KVY4_9SPHN|nr:ParB/RepB/Spo0J family partition protein [Croceibacterium atlanticum]AKH43341.1 Chromosome-partitioning protein ParB [Croceibacterium atlanticum]MBB5731953.1 ParB family chromosome partitioning protein [Croceibacterium atlanticum]